MAKTKTSAQIDQLKDQVKQLEGNWKRALADYQNLVKRTESDRSDLVRLASGSVLTKLIPTLDILERAADHSQDPGIMLAVKQFRQTLVEAGLVEIVPAVGDKYDPAIYECIETVTGTASQAETVAELVLKGYKIDDYILRPAQVKVWQRPPDNHE